MEDKKGFRIDEELRKLAENIKDVVKVVGVGGAGSKTISRLMQTKNTETELIAVNTDAQELHSTEADVKILIGEKITGGIGAKGDPKIGEKAAKKGKNDLKKN